MATTWTCANGHEVPIENEFCGTCGARRVESPDQGAGSPATKAVAPVNGASAMSTKQRGSRKKIIVGAAVVAALLGVVLVTGVVLLIAGDDEESEKGETLVVEIGDLGSCDEYSQSYVVGARFTLADASGDILATDTTSGPGEEIADHCVWEVELKNVTRSDAYELTIELPQGQYDTVPPDPQTLTYSYEEFEEKDWRLSLTQNF